MGLRSTLHWTFTCWYRQRVFRSHKNVSIYWRLQIIYCIVGPLTKLKEMMHWILWQQIIKWVLQKLITKLKAYDLTLQRGTKKWQKKKSGAGADDVFDCPWFAHKSLTVILDSITPRETKETGAGQTKKCWTTSDAQCWQVEACVHGMRQKACPWRTQCRNVKAQEEDESARVCK